MTPRRSLILSLLLLLALTVTLHHEVLLQGRVYHMDDAADGYYPARVAFRRALSEGTLPTWEPGAFAGWPLIADPYYGFFYPPNAVFFLGRHRGEPDAGPASGVPAGLGYSAALHTLLGGVGMLLYLRRRRLSAPSALLGAIGLALSSFLVCRVRHIIFVQLTALLPWLLYGIERYLTTPAADPRGRRRALALCAAATALTLLCGAHSLLHFVVLALLPYTLARLLSHAREHQPAPRLRTLLGAGLPLLGAATVGALGAAVALLPTLRTMPLTSRALQTDYGFASSYAWPALHYLQTLLLPDAFGPGEGRGAPWFARWNHWEVAGYYHGVALTLLAPLALRFRDDPGRTSRAERRALVGVGLLAIATAFGDQGPTHPLLFRLYPLYGALRCPARALFMLTLVVPILGAYGAEWLLAQAPPLRRWPRRGAATALLALLGSGAAALLLQRRGGPLHEQVLLQSLAHLLLFLGLLLGLVALRHLCALPARLVLTLLCGVTAADQLIIDRGYLQPRPADFAYGTERFRAVQWLLDQQQRVPAEQQDRLIHDPAGPFRLHNIGSTVGLPGAAGYDSVQLWRYTSYLYILNHGRPYPHPRQQDDFAAAAPRNFDSPLLDLLAVRWLIGPRQPSPRWVERFRPPPGAPPLARHEPTWDPQLRVYENPQALPRAFVIYDGQLAPTLAAEAAALARPGFDPRRQVILGTTEPVALAGPGRALTPARLTHLSRHHLVLEAEAEAPGVLVLSEVFHPGWSATVDGAPARLLPANLALRGVPLTPGRHRVELRFRFAPLTAGALLSALGLLAFALLCLGPARRAIRGQKR